jgi:hypothetical protein
MLYGLNLQTGQPVVSQPTPGMDHFATPSASDGKLLLGTGQTVEAYTIASPAPQPAAPPAAASLPTASPPAPSQTTCVLKLRSRRVKIHHPRAPRHGKHAPAPFGTVGLVAKCSQTGRVGLTGIVTELLGNKPRHGKARTRKVHLAGVHVTLTAGVARTLQLRITPSLLLALERRIREMGAFTLSSGTTRVGAQAVLRL